MRKLTKQEIRQLAREFGIPESSSIFAALTLFSRHIPNFNARDCIYVPDSVPQNETGSSPYKETGKN